MAALAVSSLGMFGPIQDPPSRLLLKFFRNRRGKVVAIPDVAKFTFSVLTQGKDLGAANRKYDG